VRERQRQPLKRKVDCRPELLISRHVTLRPEGFGLGVVRPFLQILKLIKV
jgi:hypothetical protein